MKHPLPRIHLITLGVRELVRATEFYRKVFDCGTTSKYDGDSPGCL